MENGCREARSPPSLQWHSEAKQALLYFCNNHLVLCGCREPMGLPGPNSSKKPSPVWLLVRSLAFKPLCLSLSVVCVYLKLLFLLLLLQICSVSCLFQCSVINLFCPSHSSVKLSLTPLDSWWLLAWWHLILGPILVACFMHLNSAWNPAWILSRWEYLHFLWGCL